MKKLPGLGENVKFGAKPVACLARSDLVRKAQAVGRPQDLVDIDALIQPDGPESPATGKLPASKFRPTIHVP
ncbi:MAG: hypothetical protein NTV05_05735 [Acidobacteria bacterium]|nr:hypothetical protein [Acidobacteriota bacterium]